MLDIVVMLICLFYLIDIYFIVKGFILIYMSVSLSLCVIVYGRQRRELDPLEIGLQVVVSSAQCGC